MPTIPSKNSTAQPTTTPAASNISQHHQHPTNVDVLAVSSVVDAKPPSVSAVNVFEGAALGDEVGKIMVGAVGLAVGAAGDAVGEVGTRAPGVGDAVDAVGATLVGFLVGAIVGELVGEAVGADGTMVGAAVGARVGAAVGALVGDAVGE